MGRKPISLRKTPTKATTQKAARPPVKKETPSRFPIVGVGASAGGLEAFSNLLRALPKNPGLAIVFIEHLDPHRESQLVPILTRETTMKVSEALHGMKIERDHVYIIPPNANIEISDGRLLIIRRKSDGARVPMPIDQFFRSLATARREKAIGVVLSGTASDGSAGLKAIKSGKGITFAQEETSAKYTGMPRSAIASGCVDFILPPEDIARELARIVAHPSAKARRTHALDMDADEGHDGLKGIFSMLRRMAGVDFSLYRKSTISRRIQRRMVLNKAGDLAAYAAILRDNPGEIDDLYQDILIHVTGFFREPETFKALETIVFPALVKKHTSLEDPIRIWLPGCSSGEEAYSIAMSLVEFLGEKISGLRIQIFATDVSERIIEKARQGLYRETIVDEVSPERLKRFFTKKARGYQISKTVREMCVFARQNVIQDPPFSKLDLISCRNLLIYLEPVLQKKLMPVFHYALNADGFLMLGSAETTGAYEELFRPVDQKNKIYQKKPGNPRVSFNPDGFYQSHEQAAFHEKSIGYQEESWTRLDVLKEADRVLMTKYCPPAIVVDENMEIIQFRGQITPFIEPATGEASLSLYKMVREGLQIELRGAIQRARQGGVIRKEGLQFKHGGQQRLINLTVMAIGTPATKERCFIILFEEKPHSEPPAVQDRKGRGNRRDPKTEQLQHELGAMKEHLQAVIEAQEATNEELRSANEEIQSSNEELQSTNEELETAKEELQSTNEELTTVNEELLHSNLKLSEVNNDLSNLLRGVNLPIVMLDRDLNIRRFTPAAQKTLKLLPTDAGRPITDIRPDINIASLDHMLHEVIEGLVTKEAEVQDKQGHWYLLQVRPYQTIDNKIAGAVMVLFDIDARKRNALLLKQAGDYADAIVQTVRDPLVILDGGLRVKTATRSFYKTFKVSEEQTEGKLFYKLGTGQWNIPKLRDLLEKILPKNAQVLDFEVDHVFPGIGQRRMLLNAHRVPRGIGEEELIILSIEEVKS
ncbi:MAG: chemotaxis protein CheB [Chthoniobacteraceae bacterium]